MRECVWKRLLDPEMLPYSLLEEVKKENFTTEELYKYFNEYCCDPVGSFKERKGYQLWSLFHEKERKIKGFCWLVTHPLLKKTKIEFFTIYKKLRIKGGSLDKLEELLKMLDHEYKEFFLESVRGETLKKYGWHRESERLWSWQQEGESDAIGKDG